MDSLQELGQMSQSVVIHMLVVHITNFKDFDEKYES